MVSGRVEVDEFDLLVIGEAGFQDPLGRKAFPKHPP
jgi:hypothetical protein